MATRKLLKRGDRVIYTKLTPYENYGHGLNAYDELVVAKDMQPSDQSVICFLPDAETDGFIASCMVPVERWNRPKTWKQKAKKWLQHLPQMWRRSL
ncbi:MAG: hypothetical protein H7A09_10580 [Oceanospirillaceae bacterium]|nr:hypothetical protein [Chitinophagales bacterium]MCP5326753.1 hypothetical protein [Oceanospirillaceae bacterium]